MSEEEGDGLSSRMTNAEIVKYLREKKKKETEKKRARMISEILR